MEPFKAFPFGFHATLSWVQIICVKLVMNIYEVMPF